MVIQFLFMNKFYCLFFICIGLYNNVILAQEQTGDTNLILSQAREAFQLKQYTASAEMLSIAIKKYPNNSGFRIALAQEYRALNKLDIASTILQQALDDKVENFEIYKLLIDNYYRLGYYKKGMKTVNNAIKTFNNKGMLYEKKGNLLEALQKNNQANQAYTIGIEKDSAYLENYLNLARLEAIGEQPEKACMLAEYYILKAPQSREIKDAKKILRAAYRNLYLNFKEGKINPTNDVGLKLFINSFKQASVSLEEGIEAITLCKLRSKMTMFAIEKGNLPYQLEKIWNTLLREGYFEAYHYWLFTAIEDPNSYAAWLQYHKGAEKELLQKITDLHF